MGGNIATASPVGISDLNPVWVAVGAKVLARTAEGTVELGMDDFFVGCRKTRLRLMGARGGCEGAKRRDDDIAIATSCFAMRVDEASVIKHAKKYAYGGMAALTISTPKAQAYVIGLNVTLSTNPQDIISRIHRQVGTGRRDNSDPYAQEVVGKSEPHVSGLKHTTGEAVYTDDMSSVQNKGYGALVLSTCAHTKIISLNASKVLEMKGVITFVLHAHLPSPKANIWGAAMLDELFLAVDKVTAYGQPIDMIVAKTKLQAQRAARAVEVVYEDIRPLILTIEEAIELGSFHEQYDRRMERGDNVGGVLKGVDYVAEGTTRMGGQEVPKIIYLFSQTLADISLASLLFRNYDMPRVRIAPLPEGNAWVEDLEEKKHGALRYRLNGCNDPYIAANRCLMKLPTIVALVAHKTQKAVRCMLDRTEDIQTPGQRHPFRIDWKVGFTSEHEIIAPKALLCANAGYALDISGRVVDRALRAPHHLVPLPTLLRQTPVTPPSQIRLLRAYLLISLVWYIARGRPAFSIARFYTFPSRLAS
ncbi:hypothetical protein DXG01_012729 [Tephrocybe rancida]|nr:hypothetical protein DXG01_012729 [Tephrocybe rancida]